MTALRSDQQILSKTFGLKETNVFRTFWAFAVKRQQIFFNRARGENWPWTDDPILRTYKFTNAYRASDRVSQYLISNVIYSGAYSAEDTFLRILLFKLFNRIETWEMLENQIGEIRYQNFSVSRFDRVLSKAMEKGRAIYSAAYIMAPPTGFGVTKKHSAHLMLVQRMLDDELPEKMRTSKTMEEVFGLLLSYPMIGKFLAYQLVTDFNYSELINHSEMEFTMPGPGARDGIRKCFSDIGGRSESYVIRAVTESQEESLARLGLEFQWLGKRRLQLIDVQNLFCEVDKYSRVRHPDAKGISGRVRIKQKFKPTPGFLIPRYPPKWNVTLDVAKKEK